MTQLSCAGLTLGYGDRLVCEDVDLTLPGGALTAIVGSNGCGKSTLLRGLAGALTPTRGVVRLLGDDRRWLSSREAARRLALLPQNPLVPEAVTVRELVSRGRYPHRRAFRGLSAQDRAAVEQALARTATDTLADRFVSELSGGQRQRVWVALVLAQQTPVVLLDEPTTYLDIAHQHEVLALARGLAGQGRTVVAVLHDLGQAAAYADHLVVLRAGEVLAAGAPGEVLTPETVEAAFGLAARVLADPDTGAPLVLPAVAPDRPPTEEDVWSTGGPS